MADMSGQKSSGPDCTLCAEHAVLQGTFMHASDEMCQ